MSVELPADAQRHLDDAEGWFGLGDLQSAGDEFARIPSEFMMHPKVLSARWQMHSKAKEWVACVEIGELLVSFAPEIPESHVRRSFALHELKRTREAYDFLLPAAGKFPDRWPIPYNLACYCCQLDRRDEAIQWFRKAMAIDEETVRSAAIVDPELKSLWEGEAGHSRDRS